MFGQMKKAAAKYRVIGIPYCKSSRPDPPHAGVARTPTLLADGRQAIDIRNCLAAPKIPVKVVFGGEDRITPAHHAENLSGLVAVHRFPKIGHMPHFEARREVARLVEELARAEAPA